MKLCNDTLNKILMIQNDNSNLEHANATGKNHDGKNANTPVRVLTASSIIGDNVESTSGENLATIKDIMLNLQNGSIEYVILSAGGFLGIGDKLFAVPFQELKLKTENRSFVINRSEEYIKNAPGFNQNHWPETNSRYDEVNGYWGSTSNVYAPGTAVSDDYTNVNLGGQGIIDPLNDGTPGRRTGY